MFRFKAVFLLVLLICPCALCYGQLNFAGVNGEKGYAALRGSFALDLDNGFTLMPGVGYYRMSDKEEDESGATTKFAFGARYAFNDNLTVFADGYYIPRRLGFENIAYGAGAKYTVCYRCAGLKYPYVTVRAGQSFYDINAYADGSDYPGRFKTSATAAALEAGSEIGRFFVQARYDKVIEYNNRPPSDIASNWTEIPFMTAVVQGFVRDIAAARVAYRTPWITPYAVYARYKYLAYSDYTVSVAGGLALHWGRTTISGGVEVFEQNREDNRKTYFSMSASTEF